MPHDPIQVKVKVNVRYIPFLLSIFFVIYNVSCWQVTTDS